MMMTNTLLTNSKRKILLYRGHTETADLSTTQYNPATKFKVGINATSPLVTDTDINMSIPITAGTVNDDGSNTMTGSLGGSNSTNNTTIFKEGALTADVTAQNLITNTSSATKRWIITSLTANVDKTQYLGFWLYIADQATLDKIVSITPKVGSSTTVFFHFTYTNAQLEVGWNFITTNKTAIEDLDETGTVGATINHFILDITTNNTTDSFTTGQVVYDLLRTWEHSDIVKDFMTDYPELDLDTFQVTTRTMLNSTEANGFLIDNFCLANEDTSPLATAIAKIIPESKSTNDEFTFIEVEQLI